MDAATGGFDEPLAAKVCDQDAAAAAQTRRAFVPFSLVCFISLTRRRLGGLTVTCWTPRGLRERRRPEESAPKRNDPLCFLGVGTNRKGLKNSAVKKKRNIVINQGEIKPIKAPVSDVRKRLADKTAFVVREDLCFLAERLQLQRRPCSSVFFFCFTLGCCFDARVCKLVSNLEFSSGLFFKND